MSQIKGLKYLISRAGEDGKLGRIVDAIQVTDDSPIIPVLLEREYYLGSKEDWEKFTGLKAGDMDGDGDFDRKDARAIENL